ncbi:hypothetical protein D9M71_423760 [compost metagenome]
MRIQRPAAIEDFVDVMAKQVVIVLDVQDFAARSIETIFDDLVQLIPYLRQPHSDVGIRHQLAEANPKLIAFWIAADNVHVLKNFLSPCALNVQHAGYRLALVVLPDCGM